MYTMGIYPIVDGYGPPDGANITQLSFALTLLSPRLPAGRGMSNYVDKYSLTPHDIEGRPCPSLPKARQWGSSGPAHLVPAN